MWPIFIQKLHYISISLVSFYHTQFSHIFSNIVVLFSSKSNYFKNNQFSHLLSTPNGKVRIVSKATYYTGNVYLMLIMSRC